MKSLEKTMHTSIEYKTVFISIVFTTIQIWFPRALQGAGGIFKLLS